jgi:hypothetical protein
MRKPFAALALLCVAIVLVLILNRPKPPVRTSADVRLSATNKLESSAAAVANSNRATPIPHGTNSVAVPASDAVAAAAVVKSPRSVSASIPPMPEFTNFPASIVLENMRSVFRQYSSTFGGNPVGTNPEITRMLNGGNSKQVKFIKDEDGLRINSNGELVDSWGTPFFFHQLSGTQMEIHSAGPDRVMWTADDLVVK